MDFLLRFDDKGSKNKWRMYFPFSARPIHHQGKVFTFNRKNGEQMVSNHSVGVPDYDLPVSLLHSPELGTLGTIAELRCGVRGVEWMSSFDDAGWRKAKESGHRYLSPEVIIGEATYQAPHGKRYHDVALGITLTPRPRLGRALMFDDGRWRRNMKLEEFSVEKIQSLKISELKQFVQSFEDALDEILADDPAHFDENLKAFIEAHPGLYSAYDTIKMSGLAF